MADLQLVVRIVTLLPSRARLGVCAVGRERSAAGAFGASRGVDGGAQKRDIARLESCEVRSGQVMRGKKRGKGGGGEEKGHSVAGKL